MHFGMIARTLAGVAEVRFQQFVRWVKELAASKSDIAIGGNNGIANGVGAGLGDGEDDQLLKAALEAEAEAEGLARERRWELRAKVRSGHRTHRTHRTPLSLSLSHHGHTSLLITFRWTRSKFPC
jgi:hypothetical protein